MEVKQEFTSTKPQLSENGAAVPSLRTMQDGMSTPMRKSSSQTMTIITTAEEAQEVGINSGRKQSFEKKLESPSKKTERKSKSTSARFLVDIEELFVSSGGSFSETESILSKASSTNLDFSFTLPGATAMPANDISDALRLKNHNCAYEDDLDSGNSTKIQIEPTVPIFLKFLDVKYKVVVKGSEKSILDGVTGAVHPGEVLALMGPSGGGKTTLLNLLSGRLKVNEDEGCITYNDQPYSKSLKRRIGFVLQDDVAFPHLTVKETLTYAALLRLPNTLSKKEKQERAMNVISDLGLERCQNTIIGGTFVRGISGGERKRVCIGNEILINPSLLFLDEPTSGLDSTTALRIVHMLHNIAEAGKTVVTTIHQPSSRLFNKFDKLILLGKGNSLYFGKASEAMLYFSSIGCSPLIAMNPAEFLIDLANGNINDKSFPTGLEDNVLVNSQEFRPREEWPSPIEVHEYLVGAYETKVAHIEKRKLLRPVVIEDEWEVQGRLISREWGASWCQQYSILFWRGLKVRRHDYLSCVRVIQVIVTAVILGLLWWHNDASSPKKLQDQAGLLFFISVFWGFFPVFTAIFTFPQERAMLVKERSVDMYKLSAYFLARNMSDLPLDLVLPVVFLVIVYFMVGLKLSFWAFFLTLLTVFLSIVAAQGLGLAIGAALMDVKKATTLASVIVMTFMLVGGFFIQRVPSFISWIRYVSFNYHTYRLLLRIQYSCSGSCKSPPFIQGHRLGDSAKEVGAMIAMIFGYRLIAYLCLRTMKLRS